MNPRAFVEEGIQVGRDVRIGGEDGHHFSRVLRLRVGEEVAVAAKGQGYLGELTEVDGKEGFVVIRIRESLPPHETMTRVYLAQALPKADKLDGILQHGTEAGFAGYLLFPGVRSVVRLDAKKIGSRVDRWRRIVKEASSQAQRDTVPSVEYKDSRRAILDWLNELAPDAVLFLDEEENIRTLSAVLKTVQRSATLVVCIGPEGGWDAAERDFWLKTCGAQAVTLGPRILRTETAGLVAGAAALYHFQALGGD